jgi:hypothetical protein
MKYAYRILIIIQIAIIAHFIYFEQQIPGFVMVSFNENPIPYDMLPTERTFFIVTYLSVYAVHLIIVEQIFRRRDHTVVWSKAGLRITIQLGFTILFYFLYIAIFSNLKTRHHIESILSIEEFFNYRVTITFILMVPVLISMLMFKMYSIGKNALILVGISSIFTILLALAIMYFEQGFLRGNLNDIEEERRLITNVLPIDIAIGFILWREARRNLRLDSLEHKSHA